MFFLYRFILTWLIWIIFADKKRWKEIIPTCILANYLGCATDSIMHHYKLWEYYPHNALVDFADDLGIYLVVTYLFIQYLPKERTFKRLFFYWFLWTAFAVAVEAIHLKIGVMKHYKWWTLAHSYISDWILFYIFYKYYIVFNCKQN